jgi:AraC family transcriptional regulator, regulatory protein of adaptative response / DNA-3-methyladenine glycosylase II
VELALATDLPSVALRLSCRAPFDAAGLLAFLAQRALPGVEEVVDGYYRRTIWTAEGAAVAELSPQAEDVHLRLQGAGTSGSDSVADLCRRLFDLDTDPRVPAEVLALDPVLAPLVAARPGLRVPGTVDPWELAVRAVLGQQISVAAARTVAGRLVARLGAPLIQPYGSLTHLFPRPRDVADANLSGLGLTGRRIETLQTLARAMARGEIVLDRSADRGATVQALLAIPGIGPWTVAYIAMRALGDTDAFPATDLGLRVAAERLGLDARRLEERAERWRPWRAYAAIHLWSSLSVTNAKEVLA